MINSPRGCVFRCLLIVFSFICCYLLVSQMDIIPKVGFPIEIISIGFRQVTTSSSTTTQTTSTSTSTTTSSSSTTTTSATTTSSALITQNKSGETIEQPKEAFVTFSNNDPNYLSLLKVFLDSVHAFSTRPVIAFGIGVDLNIDTNQYPRVIKRRIEQSECGASVYFCKIHAIISSNVDYGILMETDDVVNYNIDILFDVLHLWPYDYPLSPRHPDDPGNYQYFMDKLNVTKRTTPYIHAHMIWTYRAMPFLKALREHLRAGHFMGANFDETGVNVMLWKVKANHTLCKYDPYFTYSEPFEKWPAIINCSKYCYTVFLTLHGSKEAAASQQLLERLKNNRGKPDLQTPGAGGMRYINDTVATCCEPDSKRSPIHPLICEYDIKN